MKKLLVSAILAFTALSASAQLQEVGTFSVTPRISIGYAPISELATLGWGDPRTELLYEYSKIEGGIVAAIGADAKYQFAEKFGVSLGLGFNYMESDEASKIKMTVSTLDIPLLAHYDITKNLGAFAGLNFAFVLDGKCKWDGTSTSVKDNMFSTLVSLPLGLKWTFRSNLSLSAQYNIPFSKLLDVEPTNVKAMEDAHRYFDKGYLASTGDVKMSTIMLTLGYRFQF